jgi:hypothetical protein
VAKARKIVEVWQVVRDLQRKLYLAESEETRYALGYAIEAILMDANQYRGFHYFNADGNWTRDYDQDGNESRRHYFGDPERTEYVTRKIRDERVAAGESYYDAARPRGSRATL